MKLIIAGTRTLKDVSISNILDEFGITLNTGPKGDEIVHGACEGIDMLADRWAEYYCVKRRPFKIDKWVWDALGKKAGPLRNRAMAEYGDVLLAIWDGQSRGTQNMISEMERLGKPVYVKLVVPPDIKDSEGNPF